MDQNLTLISHFAEKNILCLLAFLFQLLCMGKNAVWASVLHVMNMEAVVKRFQQVLLYNHIDRLSLPSDTTNGSTPPGVMVTTHRVYWTIVAMITIINMWLKLWISHDLVRF